MLPLKETVQKETVTGRQRKGHGRIRDALDQCHGMAAHGRHPITQIGYKEDWVSVHRMKRMHHISRHKQNCKNPQLPQHRSVVSSLSMISLST